MNRTIKSGARKIIYKVFLQCLKESEAGQILSDIENAFQRTADMTGVSVNTKVHFFYTVKKQVPTLRSLLFEIRQDLAYDGSREHLRKVLKCLGFSYKKCQNDRIILMEK
ncbi:hypothetical protein ACJJTC_016067 [Scirpophaga incertulas]